ncbi:MAG: MupA/Atu3671 family FMN-dependent luciferase-like monooxygenase, partial [Gemmatimonadales bacterium]
HSTTDGATEHYRVHGWALPPEASSADPDTLVAAFTAFLARLTGNHRFDVGYSDEALRNGVGDLTPSFADVVPLRVVTSDGESFASFCASQADALEQVRKRFTYPRDLVGRHPSLRSQGVRGSYPVAVILGPEGSAPPVEPVGHDLTLVFTPGGGATWIYHADRLSQHHVEAIERQFVAFLVQALNHPERRCADMPLLMGEELDCVLNQWNATERSVDDVTIHHLIERQAARTPDERAVVAGGRTLTFDQLNRRANQLARLLRDRGVSDETLVGICMDRSGRMMVALLGVLKAGAAYVPLDPTYPAQRLAFMVQDSGCGAILTENHHLGALPKNGASVICLDTQWDEAGAYDDSNLDLAVRPDQLCYVIYTSGSTGTPKGVMVEHRNVVNFFVGMDAHLGTDRGVWLAVTSLSFDISVLELFWTLARGFTVVLYAGDETAAPARSTRPISFSLSYFAADEGAEDDKYRLLIEGAKFADAHGFEAVWTPERHYHAFGGLYPNPSVASSALAMITKQIHLRAGSVVLPLHHPTRVAEEWSVVDNLSNGRVGISFASGWMPNDFLIRPENFADKKNVMLRDIDVVRRLWRGETVKFPGPIGDEVEVTILPHPVQPELPFWITTAGNPETFAAAGKAGANLLTHLLGQTVEELRDKLAAYRSARADAGHEGPGHVTLMLHTFVSDDLEALKDIVREPLKGYLSTATNLVKQYAWSFPAFKKREGQTFGDIDLDSLTAEESDALMEHA